MNSLKLWFPHTQHTNIGKENVAIFNLMLRTVGSYIHSIAAFYKIAFAKDSTYNSKTACRNNTFIGKFNFYIFHDILSFVM